MKTWKQKQTVQIWSLVQRWIKVGNQDNISITMINKLYQFSYPLITKTLFHHNKGHERINAVGKTVTVNYHFFYNVMCIFQMTSLQMLKLRHACISQSTLKHFLRRMANQRVWEWPRALVSNSNKFRLLHLTNHSFKLVTQM